MNYQKILHLSGGITSYAAGKRLADAGERFQMVFADTIIEDSDTYRFLIEGAAKLSGIDPREITFLVGLALALPDLQSGSSEFRSKRLRERKVALAELRSRSALMIPALIWLCDGRTPFEVFRDERYLGNSRVDPCSRVLKRELLDKWAQDNCDESTVHYFGLDWTEPNRLRRFRMAMKDRHIEFPMAEEPFMTKSEVINQLFANTGIAPPRLYRFGFPHGNCGGGCIKFGQKQAALLLEVRPKFFGWWADEEQDMREFLGRDVSILRDRRKDHQGTLPLRVLQQRIESGRGCDLFDLGSCNCFEIEE